MLLGLPDLGDIEFVIAGPGCTLRGPADALATAILDNAYPGFLKGVGASGPWI